MTCDSCSALRRFPEVLLLAAMLSLLWVSSASALCPSWSETCPRVSCTTSASNPTVSLHPSAALIDEWEAYALRIKSLLGDTFGVEAGARVGSTESEARFGVTLRW